MSVEEGLGVAKNLGYPLLVRPSYVLGGRAMEIVYGPDELAEYLGREIMEDFEATFDGRKLKILGYYRNELPGNWKLYQGWVEAGFVRAGNGKSWQDFEIQASSTVILTDDVRGALARPFEVVVEHAREAHGEPSQLDAPAVAGHIQRHTIVSQ